MPAKTLFVNNICQFPNPVTKRKRQAGGDGEGTEDVRQIQSIVSVNHLTDQLDDLVSFIWWKKNYIFSVLSYLIYTGQDSCRIYSFLRSDYFPGEDKNVFTSG